MRVSLPRLAAAVSLSSIGVVALAGTTAAVQVLASTDIQTMVCSTDSAPVITIDVPKSDTTVTSNTVAVEGSALRTRSINVTVDGVYDQTIPIIPTAARYDLEVNVAAGTRTIQLEALGICGNARANKGVVVTVAPGEQLTPPAATIEPVGQKELAYEQAINAPSGLRRMVTPGDALRSTGKEIVAGTRELAPPLLFIVSSGTAALGAAPNRWRQRITKHISLRRGLLVGAGILGALSALSIGG